MAPPALIADLVERFARHRDAYRSGRYNETQLRREFIDPFFKALGWDIDNERGYAEAYKDVIHEDAIRVGGGVRAPDYCFRIGGVRKFFVEAKRPAVRSRRRIGRSTGWCMSCMGCRRPRSRLSRGRVPEGGRRGSVAALRRFVVPPSGGPSREEGEARPPEGGTTYPPVGGQRSGSGVCRRSAAVRSAAFRRTVARGGRSKTA